MKRRYARGLIRLRGIGLVSATVLADEVFFRDFRNRREVAGYLGLASSPWASGRVQRDQGITKSGNPRARRTAIELAWLWLRHQPGSFLTLWFRQRVGTARGRMRRIILVVLTHKLNHKPTRKPVKQNLASRANGQDRRFNRSV